MSDQIDNQIAQIISRGQLEKAAVIIFDAGDSDPPGTRTLQSLKQSLIKAGLSPDAVVIVCNGGIDVELMSDEDLAEMGLIRLALVAMNGKPDQQKGRI